MTGNGEDLNMIEIMEAMKAGVEDFRRSEIEDGAPQRAINALDAGIDHMECDLILKVTKGQQ